VLTNFLSNIEIQEKMPEAKKRGREEEVPECFCGETVKVIVGKKDQKVWHTCNKKYYDKETQKNYGGCDYFRGQSDEKRNCQSCGRPEKGFIKDGKIVGTSKCVNKDCSVVHTKETHVKGFQCFLDEFDLSVCGCGSKWRISVDGWPFVRTHCAESKYNKETKEFEGGCKKTELYEFLAGGGFGPVTLV
jgi:hypothetical protein